MSPPDRGCIASFCIRGKEKHIAISAGAKQYRMRAMRLYFTSYEIPGYDTACFAVHENNVKHFCTRVHLYLTVGDLPIKCGVCTQQKLLPGLATCIKRP